MVEVYAVRIDEPVEEDLYNGFLSCVSDEKREKINKFYFMDDSKRTLYGDLLLRYLACKKLKTQNNKLVFYSNEFGKPFLQNYHEFHFNISHSGIWTVCATSKKEIGVDIEQIKDIDLDVAKRFFAESEYEMLMSQPEEMQLDYFYSLWTLKESYIKCIGKGLSIPLNQFKVNLNKNPITISPTCVPPIYLFNIPWDGDYKLSICSEENTQHLKASLIKINNIKEILLYGS